MPDPDSQKHSLKTVTTINGRQVTKNDARVSVFDNAVLYADGVFETFLALGDKVAFHESHLSRLYRGAEVVGLELPVDSTKLAAWMIKTIKLHPANIKKLRLTITSGESAGWVGQQGKPQVILSAAPHTIPNEPFRVAVSDLHIDHRSVFRTIKTLSYGINAAALKRAKARGCDDALLLNTDRQIAELSSANIFWVTNGTIHTPSLKSGCLGGVTREHVIDRLRALGYSLVEIETPLESLLSADEIFLSSSIKLVLPIDSVTEEDAKHEFPVGPITQTLRKDIFASLNLTL